MSVATRASGCPRSTSTGDLPPSSSVTGTSCSLAARITARPTAVLPVKKVIERQAAKAAPMEASPVTTATSSSEKVSAINETRRSLVAG